MRKPLAVSLTTLLLAGCSLFGDRSSYEQPDYTVLASIGPSAEIRHYAPRLAAEATVEAESEESGRNAAFRLLFNYITGGNKPAESISMTTPVATGTQAETISMTAPVQTAAGTGTASMRFFFPKAYTADTAPEPLDPRIRIITLPAETMAVLTYTGSTGEDKASKQRAALSEILESSDWQAAGPPSAMFYDPPWTLWFLRRNEVALPVTR